MTKDLIKDIVTVTTMPNLAMEALVDKACLCIAQNVLENKESITDLDMGIGRLLIKNDGKKLSYKFIPSAKLEKSLIHAICDGESPLIDALEEGIVTRIRSVYKELF